MALRKASGDSNGVSNLELAQIAAPEPDVFDFNGEAAGESEALENVCASLDGLTFPACIRVLKHAAEMLRDARDETERERLHELAASVDALSANDTTKG